ncbi:LysR substrate-binding domain-containing protein [Nocardia jiangxiensis]|uniref:LysR substrate-binding domain-containing protein n=1 Tax=Nocardia jiangxiensis TaxID=282685 RepID=A0ABW6SFU0_9NOCA|nr:LysR substrate-binding domain-containing protein [Nocardia jiangxiensis]
MELRQLRQFVTVAETLNFRTAARHLHMTQPPLSVSLRKLEDEIGAPLFTRDRHTVHLTRAGEAALASARSALFHAEETMRIARSTATGATGSLHIGFVGSAKNTLLPRLLPRLRRDYPGVVLRFTEDNNTRLVDALERGAIDVAIVRVPLGRHSTIRYQTVEHDRFVVAIPARHRLAGRPRLSLAEVAAEPLIDYTADAMPGLHAASATLFQEAGLTPRVVQEALQVQTVVFLVESGLGVALVPSTTAKRTGDGVVFRPLEPEPTVGIGLAIAVNPEFEGITVQHFQKLALAPYKRSPEARP